MHAANAIMMHMTSEARFTGQATLTHKTMPFDKTAVKQTPLSLFEGLKVQPEPVCVLCHWSCDSAFDLRLVALQALNRDVAEVNELLPEQDRLELLDMVQSNMTRQNKREV